MTGSCLQLWLALIADGQHVEISALLFTRSVDGHGVLLLFLKL